MCVCLCVFVRVCKINEGNAKQMSKYSQNEKVNEIVVEEWKRILKVGNPAFFIAHRFLLCINSAVKLIYAIQSAEVGPSVILPIPIRFALFFISNTIHTFHWC